jgi:cytoskeletal protein RodZ
VIWKCKEEGHGRQEDHRQGERKTTREKHHHDPRNTSLHIVLTFVTWMTILVVQVSHQNSHERHPREEEARRQDDGPLADQEI